MHIARAIPVLIVAMLISGCGAGTPPTGSGGPASAGAASAPPTSAALSAPASTATPPGDTPRPTSTPLPVPPKPTSLGLDEDIESICDPDDDESTCAIGDSTFTLTWTKPRTKKVEIRVYGVTECYGADAEGTMIDGWCLRQDDPLPADARVLLAKVPASDGQVKFRMEDDGPWFATLEGVPVYAFVVAAYNADGEHSNFAIAARAEFCLVADVACDGVDGPETFQPGSWMTTIVPDLRVRSQPEVSAESVKYTPLLPLGTEFGIVRGPEFANGYRWYLVELAPGILDGGATRGWVADGSRDGEPWIESGGIDEG